MLRVAHCTSGKASTGGKTVVSNTPSGSGSRTPQSNVSNTVVPRVTRRRTPQSNVR